MSGPISLADFRDFFAVSQAHPDYHPDLDRLIVVAGVTAFPSGDDIRAIAAKVRDRAATSAARFAVVATDPLAVGVVNMLFRLAGLAARFAIFETVASAEAWLAEARPTGDRKSVV